MLKHLCLFFFILSLILSYKSYGQSIDYVIIRKIEKNKIHYDKYDNSGQEVIDISDLEIWDRVKGKDDVFNRFYFKGTDLRILLLEKGYAQLKDTTNAQAAEIRSQNEARSKKIGLWFKKEQRTQATKESNKPKEKSSEQTFDLGKIFSFIWKAIIALSSLGIIGLVAKFLYKKLFIQKRYKLVIFGEPSTGKSALLYNLIDPDVPPTTILNLSVSKGVTRKERPNCIAKGRLEIFPELTDIPGAAFATVWDNLLRIYNQAWVCVLAPVRLNGVQDDGEIKMFDIEKDVDQKYIYVQLGIVQAFIGGALGAKDTKKPKILVVFISKFDLFSHHAPEDSSSYNVKQKVLELFKEHISVAKSTARKIEIPCEVIIGSSVKKWNTEKVMNTVTSTIYKIIED